MFTLLAVLLAVLLFVALTLAILAVPVYALWLGCELVAWLQDRWRSHAAQ